MQDCQPNEYDANSICYPCDTACATCVGSTNTQCLTCSNGYNQIGSQSPYQCVSPCGSGKYPDGANCPNCDISCKECLGGLHSQCTECPSENNYKYDIVGANFRCVSSCPTGTYTDIDTCKTCQSPCASCIGAAVSDCTSCQPNLKRSAPGSTFSCLVACPDNRYDDNGTCMLCDSSCQKCSEAFNNNCIECPIGKFKGNTGSPFSCVDYCPGNNYLDIDTCKPCDSTCGSCQGPATTQCITSCSGNLKRSSEATTFSCVVSCPVGTYDDVGTCKACHPTCATCSASLSNQCITCQPNFQ